MRIPDHLRNAITNEDIGALETEIESQSSLVQDELDAALGYAIREASANVVGSLLSHGARLKTLSFHDLLRREDYPIIQTLIDHGWDINSRQFGYTAVHFAASGGRTNLLRWLLDHGASPNTPTRRRHTSLLKERTPLVTAAKAPQTSGLEILLEFGAEMDHTALFGAIMATSTINRIHHMEILLDNGANVNHWIKERGTPLHAAVKMNSKQVAQFLLERGADSTIKNLLGQTPADKANSEGKLELFELLNLRNENEP